MFKIDRKKLISLVSGVALATSLGLYGYDSKDNDTNLENDKIEFADAENTYMTAVYYDCNVSIIIPVRSFYAHNDGFVSIDTGFNNPMFSISDITIFYDKDYMSGYDQAMMFAEAISDEVYLYSDVMKGKPVNLVTDDKIAKEMGVK